jgi:hypothetical protein
MSRRGKPESDCLSRFRPQFRRAISWGIIRAGREMAEPFFTRPPGFFQLALGLPLARVKNDRRPLVLAIAALPAVGHLSVAAIYITMGSLTGLVSLGLRHGNPDVRSAIYAIKDQPFGPALLISLIVCSGALALWRGLQAFADLEEKGRTLAGMAQRGRFVAGAAIYLGLSVLTGRILLNQPTFSGEQIARASASHVVIHPLGWALLCVAGLVCAGVGVFYLYQALTGKFHDWFRCDEMSRVQQISCFLLGRLGYVSRGVILIVIGYFLVVGGYFVRPGDVTGQSGALDAIFQQPLGRWFVAFIAVGLVAHGLFALASARYGKIPERKIEEVVKKTTPDMVNAAHHRDAANISEVGRHEMVNP